MKRFEGDLSLRWYVAGLGAKEKCRSGSLTASGEVWPEDLDD
jgi:hypothetical protein